jgi:hypothetical protein
MFYIITAISLLVPVIFGSYLLLSPMRKLIADIAWLRLPMPQEGTAAHSALRYFWRGMGVMAWLVAAVMAYLLFS